MTPLDWLSFSFQVAGLALAATLWFVVAGWCITGLFLDLRFRELLVPLWCFLSGDPAVTERLDEILAARRREYEPRHALPRDEQKLADIEARMWLASYRWPPFL